MLRPPAQLVEVKDVKGRVTTYRADEVSWLALYGYSYYHRPALHDGLPVVSAEGLRPGVRYVATAPTNHVLEYAERPKIGPMASIRAWSWVDYAGREGEVAPSTHRIPTDWRESLAIVEGR